MLLIPILTASHSSGSKSNSSCFDKFCCVMFYGSELLFLVTVFFIVAAKIFGPWLLIYAMIEAVRVGLKTGDQNLTPFYVLGIFSIVFPLFIFVVTYIITNYCCNKVKK
jgi:hypothetical protein